MSQVKVRIVLTRASDDPKVNERSFQEELGSFGAALRSAGVKYTARGMAFDSVDALGYQLPEFYVFLGSSITAVAALCGAWIQARYGRKVRIKLVMWRRRAETSKKLSVCCKGRRFSSD